MKLINEIIETETILFDIEFGYKTPYPINYSIPFKKGDNVIFDDFSLAKHRPQHMLFWENLVDEKSRISNLFANVNRVGTIKAIKKKKQTRNRGRIRTVTFTMVVSFTNKPSIPSISNQSVTFDEDCVEFVISNPEFIIKVD